MASYQLTEGGREHASHVDGAPDHSSWSARWPAPANNQAQANGHSSSQYYNTGGGECDFPGSYTNGATRPHNRPASPYEYGGGAGSYRQPNLHVTVGSGSGYPSNMNGAGRPQATATTNSHNQKLLTYGNVVDGGGGDGSGRPNYTTAGAGSAFPSYISGAPHPQATSPTHNNKPPYGSVVDGGSGGASGRPNYTAPGAGSAFPSYINGAPHPQATNTTHNNKFQYDAVVDGGGGGGASGRPNYSTARAGSASPGYPNDALQPHSGAASTAITTGYNPQPQFKYTGPAHSVGNGGGGGGYGRPSYSSAGARRWSSSYDDASTGGISKVGYAPTQQQYAASRPYATAPPILPPPDHAGQQFYESVAQTGYYDPTNLAHHRSPYR